MAQYDASNSQTAAYIPSKFGVSTFVSDALKILKVFPLSNQSSDHTLEAVDITQWKLTAGVWTVMSNYILQVLALHVSPKARR
jgi:hypothetical protein